MTPEQAKQIADLLNSQNQLSVTMTPEAVLADAGRFLFVTEAAKVICCVMVKRVQWYQDEIKFLSVAPERRRLGYAARLVKAAELVARENEALVVQAVIRVDNSVSRELFTSLGYREGISFFNKKTNADLVIYQKGLTTSHDV